MKLVVAAIAFSILAGCSGSRGAPDDPEVPVVVSVSPNGTGVDAFPDIVVEFSVAMDPSTLETRAGCNGAVQVSADGFETCADLSGGTSVSGLKVFTYHVPAALEELASYTVRTTAAALSKEGLAAVPFDSQPFVVQDIHLFDMCYAYWDHEGGYYDDRYFVMGPFESWTSAPGPTQTVPFGPGPEDSVAGYFHTYNFPYFESGYLSTQGSMTVVAEHLDYFSEVRIIIPDPPVFFLSEGTGGNAISGTAFVKNLFNDADACCTTGTGSVTMTVESQTFQLGSSGPAGSGAYILCETLPALDATQARSRMLDRVLAAPAALRFE